MSKKLNVRGFKTVALSGANSNEERTEAIRNLESENENDRLDYIITVDIFNEGIDIPKVNQIIMLRPTESAIIFVQQLGRGLRKLDSKSYLTVIDFIGNHNNNYLIPIALYGDTSYNKDKLRKLLADGSADLPGVSTINFDRIAKEKIYESIDSANMSLLRDLKKDYSLLKFRLGRNPMMMDFLESESRDPFLFVKYSKSYYNFVSKVDSDFVPSLDKDYIELLNLFSLDINNGKRVEESIILKELLKSSILEVSKLIAIIDESYGYTVSEESIKSALINLNFEFVNKTKNILILEGGKIKRHHEFSLMLENKLFTQFLKDTIGYSISSYTNKYSKEIYNDGFLLYQKYSRKDVCRLLNWDKDVSSTVYGYRTRKSFTPCFVTYNKGDDIEDSINYNDHFVSPSEFAWESRSNRKIHSPEIQNVINSKRVLLFIKKADSEGTEFYYMGDVSIVEDSIKQSKMPDSGQPVVHFRFKLDNPVPENLYSYITDSKGELRKEVKKENFLADVEELPQLSEPDTPIYQLPLYDLVAAAGSFSEMQTEKEFTMIDVPEKYNREGHFAFKVIGESMNRRIPNGSICIFKQPVVGSRAGKILLIEYYNRQDPDLHSHFTVKTYSSTKIMVDGRPRNESIILKPNSDDSTFTDIIITEEDMAENAFHVVGEYVGILDVNDSAL